MIHLPIVDTRKKSSIPLPVMNWKKGQTAVGFEQYPSEVRTLKDLLEQLPGAPKRTAALGQTSDGLPLLFNLADSRPGSLLVVSDHTNQKITFMKVLAASLAKLNRPEEVRFAIITSRPDEWQTLESDYPGHFMNIAAHESKQAEDLIRHLCDLVEARQKGMRVGTAYVLLLDGITSVVHGDVDLKKQLAWLVRCGAKQQIWPVAVLDSHEFMANDSIVELFKTRITGQVTDPQAAARLMPPRFYTTSGENVRQPLTVRIHQHWRQFYLPEIQA